MNARERVLSTIEHKMSDRVPLDINIRPEALLLLKKYFRIEDDDKLLDRLGIDIRYVHMSPPKNFKLKQGLTYFSISKEYSEFWATLLDEWGTCWEPVSTGEYWRITYHPLQYIELDNLIPPDINAPGRFEKAYNRIKKYEGKYYIIGVNSSLFEQAWFLRGYETLIKDFYFNKSYVNKLLDKILSWKIEQGKRLAELGVDAIQIGDDLSTQFDLMLSPKILEEFLFPRYRKWINELKKRYVQIFFHTDGAIEKIIPYFINMGVDVIDPLQPECNNLRRVKELYGEKLTFHGCISVQRTLAFGTIKDVKNEVRSVINIMGKNGGYILSPAHKIDVHMPIENILSLYDCAIKNEV